MADKRAPLVTGEFYHVYNRGVAHQPTFQTKGDYDQALLALSYYHFRKPSVRLSRFKELSRERRQQLLIELEESENTHVKIIGFVFMPNHFHFLLEQTQEGGISTFLSKFSNSYTKYFNAKNKRVGPVFQGVFKVVRIETEEQLVHLSRYIHLNPLVSFVVKENEFLSYPWSSLPNFLRGESSLVWMDPVLGYFSSPKSYEEFVLDQIDYGRKLEQMKHLAIDI